MGNRKKYLAIGAISAGFGALIALCARGAMEALRNHHFSDDLGGCWQEADLPDDFLPKPDAARTELDAIHEARRMFISLLHECGWSEAAILDVRFDDQFQRIIAVVLAENFTVAFGLLMDDGLTVLGVSTDMAGVVIVPVNQITIDLATSVCYNRPWDESASTLVAYLNQHSTHIAEATSECINYPDEDDATA